MRELRRAWLGLWLALACALATTAALAQDAGPPTGDATDAAAAPPEVAPAEGRASMPARSPRPLRVGVALFVESAGRINEQAGTFEAAVALQLRWHDASLAFDPRAAGVDRMEYSREAAVARLASIWSPRLTLANLSSPNPQIEHGLQVHADGAVVYVQRFRAVFESRFELASFPFDAQALTVRVTSERFDNIQLALVQDQADLDASGLRDDLRISGWRPVELAFEAGLERRWNGDQLPKVEARLVVRRDPAPHLFFLFIPLLLILLFPSAALYFAQVDLPPRMILWGNASMALVALSFTLSVRYPALSVASLIGQSLTIAYGYAILGVLMTVTLFSPRFADRLKQNLVLDALVSALRWAIPAALVLLVCARALATAYG